MLPETTAATSNSILIVDDDPDIRQALSDMLEHEGYRVNSVATGAEAIRQVKESHYAAVLLDMKLPDLDGHALLKRFLQLHPKLPVIVLTGYATEDNTVGSLIKGAFAYLTKPYRPAEVKATLRRAVAVEALAAKAEEAESALSESEERFRQLAENINEVFWLADLEKGRILYISPAYEQVWGRTCESLYANRGSWLDAVHQEDRPRVLEALARQVEGGYHEEYRVVRPDGSIRWIRDRAFPIRSESDAVYRLAGIAEDITAQKNVERRRAAQYAITQILAESSAFAEAAPKVLQAICKGLGWDIGAIWEGDAHDDVLRCVDMWLSPGVTATAFETLTRRIPLRKGVGLPGRVWANGEPIWIPDIVQDSNFPRARAAAEGGLHGALAFPIRWMGQMLGVFEFFSQDVRSPDEDLLRMLRAVGSQLGQFTERIRAQEALHQAYHRIEAILVSLPCSILIVDEDYRIVYANPLARRQFGPGQSTLVGSLVHAVLPLSPDEWPKLMSDLDAMEGVERAGWDREFEMQKRLYRYRCFPVAVRGGGGHQVGLVLWDITEQKHLQDQLIQAEKLASLGTLVSGMAHEINNPVQSILGMAELIVQESDREKMKEFAQDIVECATHIGAVVRHFACYARPSFRNPEEELDLGERLVEAVKMVQRCPQFGYVEVVYQLQPVPLLRGRRSEIDQVLVNIISNAVEAMQGRGRLTLSTRQEGNICEAIVSDTGPGIPKAIIGKVFDPFVTTKDPGKGTGLGLSVAYKIVEKYGGRILVESEAGKGAMFRIQFPVNRESQEVRHELGHA